MNTNPQPPPTARRASPPKRAARRRGRGRAGERGSATLVVLALLFIMAALALGNNRTLHQLHQELDLVEQHQLRQMGVIPQRRPIAATPTPAPAEVAPSASEPETTASPPSAAEPNP